MFSIFEVCTPSKRNLCNRTDRNEDEYLDWKDCLKKKIQGFFRAAHENPSAQRFLRSHASIDYERNRQCFKYKNIVHPFSFFR